VDANHISHEGVGEEETTTAAMIPLPGAVTGRKNHSDAQ
jgi:hypothetical protein